MDKILRINMGAAGGPQVKSVPIGSYAGLGGRALTSTIIAKEVPPLCHPLGEDNKLVIAPGLLSGSAAAMSGRISVGCKSPLTGGIKEANAGGMASQMLGRLGIAAIVLEGKPQDGTLYKAQHQQGQGRHQTRQQPEDARQLRGYRKDEGRARRQGQLHFDRTSR